MELRPDLKDARQIETLMGSDSVSPVIEVIFNSMNVLASGLPQSQQVNTSHESQMLTFIQVCGPYYVH